MNKQLVDRLLPLAYETLAEAEVGIAKNGRIDKSYRGQISSFGAAVSNGSLLSAVAFFSQQAGAAVDREKLMVAINRMMGEAGLVKDTGKTLFETIQDNLRKRNYPERYIKEQVLSCAVALKLAMNLYQLTDKNAGEEGAS